MACKHKSCKDCPAYQPYYSSCPESEPDWYCALGHNNNNEYPDETKDHQDEMAEILKYEKEVI